MAGPLTAEQVLEQLDFLTTLEVALILEYLSVQCAFGHDLAADEGGPTTPEGRAVADAAFGLAFAQMSRLKGADLALHELQREPKVEPAASTANTPPWGVDLAPPSAAQLEHVVSREREIARSVDEQYSQLAAALTPDIEFEPGVLEHVQALVQRGTDHLSSLGELENAVNDPVPAELLRATRRHGPSFFRSSCRGVRPAPGRGLIAKTTARTQAGDRAARARDLRRPARSSRRRPASDLRSRS